MLDNFIPKPKKNANFLLNALIPIRAVIFFYTWSSSDVKISGGPFESNLEQVPKSERALKKLFLSKGQKNPFYHNHCILYNSHIF